MALCENTALEEPPLEESAHGAGIVPGEGLDMVTPAPDTETATGELEVYRVRIEVTTIETETGIIEDLFRAYQAMMQRIGKPVDPDLLDNFIRFIVYTVKRLEISHRAEFIELCIRTARGETRLFIETLIPKKRPGGRFNPSRETGMRLTHFLKPSSGRDQTGGAAHPNQTPQPGAGEESSLLMEIHHTPKDPPTDDNSSGFTLPIHKGAALYMKHVEELEWKPALGT